MMMPPIDPINILAKNGIAAIFFNKMSPVQYIVLKNWAFGPLNYTSVFYLIIPFGNRPQPCRQCASASRSPYYSAPTLA